MSNDEIYTVFDFKNNTTEFDELSSANGFTYWFARDLAKMLGYASYDSFNKVINKAIGVCVTVNIDIIGNFEKISHEYDAKKVDDFKLSRFACYIVAMNGDASKPKVAMAQAYFAAMSVSLKKYVDESSDFERISIRQEISENEKTLSGTAKSAGVDQYGLFQNAGYSGLYNMNLKKLKSLKGLPEKRSPLDYMGSDELAANLFRITQTEAKLRSDKISGQKDAENTAETVGRIVRKTMYDISGQRPEDLAVKEDIKKVKSKIKGSEKEFKKIDR